VAERGDDVEEGKAVLSRRVFFALHLQAGRHIAGGVVMFLSRAVSRGYVEGVDEEGKR
jgi:hypothetical protein